MPNSTGFIDFNEQISEPTFSKLFKTPENVQDGLNKINRKSALVEGGSLTYYGKEEQNEQETSDNMEEAQRTRERIDNYTRILQTTTDEENRTFFQDRIAQENITLKRLERSINRRDGSDLLLGKTEFQTNRMYANGLNRLAERIGEWFETGAVGPGTVTYRDLTFTAE